MTTINYDTDIQRVIYCLKHIRKILNKNNFIGFRTKNDLYIFGKLQLRLLYIIDLLINNIIDKKTHVYIGIIKAYKNVKKLLSNSDNILLERIVDEILDSNIINQARNIFDNTYYVDIRSKYILINTIIKNYYIPRNEDINNLLYLSGFSYINYYDKNTISINTDIITAYKLSHNLNHLNYWYTIRDCIDDVFIYESNVNVSEQRYITYVPTTFINVKDTENMPRINIPNSQNLCFKYDEKNKKIYFVNKTDVFICKSYNKSSPLYISDDITKYYCNINVHKGKYKLVNIIIEEKFKRNINETNINETNIIKYICDIMEKIKTIEHNDKLYIELMEVSMSPTRLEWIIDMDQIKRIQKFHFNS